MRNANINLDLRGITQTTVGVEPFTAEMMFVGQSRKHFLFLQELMCWRRQLTPYEVISKERATYARKVMGSGQRIGQGTIVTRLLAVERPASYDPSIFDFSGSFDRRSKSIEYLLQYLVFRVYCFGKLPSPHGSRRLLHSRQLMRPRNKEPSLERRLTR